jgi:hypothetical protein
MTNMDLIQHLRKEREAEQEYIQRIERLEAALKEISEHDCYFCHPLRCLRIRHARMCAACIAQEALEEKSEPHQVSDPNTLEAKEYSKAYWEKRTSMKPTEEK